MGGRSIQNGWSIWACGSGVTRNFALLVGSGISALRTRLAFLQQASGQMVGSNTNECAGEEN